MKKTIRLTYLHHTSTKGYGGFWNSNYSVSDVIDVETNEVLASFYQFKNSTIFKGKNFKEGDIIEAEFTVEVKGNTLKLLRPSNMKKVK